MENAGDTQHEDNATDVDDMSIGRSIHDSVTLDIPEGTDHDITDRDYVHAAGAVDELLPDFGSDIEVPHALAGPSDPAESSMANPPAQSSSTDFVTSATVTRVHLTRCLKGMAGVTAASTQPAGGARVLP